MMKTNFTERVNFPELMDMPEIPPKDVFQALRELETINRYLGGYKVVLEAIEKTGYHSPKSILDIGCGGGDMLRSISDHFSRRNIKTGNMCGIDINPSITSFAESRSKNYANIRYVNCNIWSNHVFEEKSDIVINSLFCHHFNNEQLIELIKRMYDLCNECLIINDLHRHWFAYHSIKTLTGIFSHSYLVRYDGPLSVARSLTRAEWLDILRRAGMKDFEINWKWAWRWQIIIRKNAK